MALLSAEHTEFTWNQETWEDKLIQVEVIPPAEAGVGRWWWWRPLWGWPVGSLGASKGHSLLLSEDLGSTGVSTADEPPWGSKSPAKQCRVTPCPPVPKPTGHWRWIRALWVQRLGKRAREGESQLKVTQPSWSTAHRCLLPPQFLRNSLKKTWGSNWSLPLSKELNNQIESFDSPSLEKVGSQRQGSSDREGTPGTVKLERVTLGVRPAVSVAVYRVLGGEMAGWSRSVAFSVLFCFVFP